MRSNMKLSKKLHRDFLNTSDIAEYLKVTQNTVIHLLNKGCINGFQMAGKSGMWTVRYEDFIKYLKYKFNITVDAIPNEMKLQKKLQKDILALKDIAEYLRLSPKTLKDKYIRTGLLKGTKMHEYNNCGWSIRREDFIHFVKTVFNSYYNNKVEEKKDLKFTDLLDLLNNVEKPEKYISQSNSITWELITCRVASDTLKKIDREIEKERSFHTLTRSDHLSNVIDKLYVK